MHEDSWGMIELVPVENLAEREATVQEARQFGEEHREGVGWTDMYEIPEPAHSVAERHISLSDLRALLAPWLPEASEVQSGYSTYRETLPQAFAFGDPAFRSGAFYGSHSGDAITSLNVLCPSVNDKAAVARFANALSTLGEQHSLMLADWWSGRLVDLRDRAALDNYLSNDDTEETG